MADLTVTWAYSNLVDAANEAHEIGEKLGYVEAHLYVHTVVLPHSEAQAFDDVFMDGVRDGCRQTHYGEHSGAIENDPTKLTCVSTESPYDQGQLVALYESLIEQGRQPGRVMLAKALAEGVVEAEEAYEAEVDEYQTDHDAWDDEVADFDADPDNDPDDRPDEPVAPSTQYVAGYRYVLGAVQSAYGITDDEVEQ